MTTTNFDYVAESARTASGEYHGSLVSLDEMRIAFENFVLAAIALDRIKKLLFYGQDIAKGRVAKIYDGATASAAYRRLDDAHMRTDRSMSAADYQQIIHAVLGSATEAGEMVEHLQDVIFLGQNLDLVNLTEEVFDDQWYHAMFCRVVGTTFERGQRTNIAKLQKRFPHKFTTEAANNRDLGAEREALEGEGI